MPAAKTDPRYSFLTYCKAKRASPAWIKTLPSDFYTKLRCFTKHMNTSLDCCMVAIFGAIVSVIGPKTLIEISSPYWRIKPNIFLLAIGLMGCGKSQAFEHLFSNAIRHIENKFKVSLVVLDITYAGVLNFMDANNGRCMIGGDELSNVLEKAYSSKSDEFQSFRSMANTMHSGHSYTKHLGSKSINIKYPLLSICGATQPHPFCIFYKKLLDFHNGTADRFLPVTASTVPPIGESEQFMKLVDESDENCKTKFIDEFYKMLELLYEINITTRTYNLSGAAKNYMTESAANEKEASREAIQLADEFIDTAASTFDDIPLEPPMTKQTDYAVKFGWLISQIQNYWGVKTTAELLHNDSLFVIDVHALTMGSQLVEQFDKQRREYMNLCKEETATLTSLMQPPTDIEMAKMILLFPGNCVTPYMFTKYYRKWCNSNKINATNVKNAMILLDANLSAGMDQFVGNVVQRSNRTTFYKASNNEVDYSHIVEFFHLTRTNYFEQYHTVTPYIPGLVASKELFHKYVQELDQGRQELQNKAGPSTDKQGNEKTRSSKQKLHNRKRKLISQKLTDKIVKKSGSGLTVFQKLADSLNDDSNCATSENPPQLQPDLEQESRRSTNDSNSTIVQSLPQLQRESDHEIQLSATQ